MLFSTSIISSTTFPPQGLLAYRSNHTMQHTKTHRRHTCIRHTNPPTHANNTARPLTTTSPHTDTSKQNSTHAAHYALRQKGYGSTNPRNTPTASETRRCTPPNTCVNNSTLPTSTVLWWTPQIKITKIYYSPILRLQRYAQHGPLALTTCSHTSTPGLHYSALLKSLQAPSSSMSPPVGASA